MSLSLNTDRLLVRAAGGSTRYLHVSFHAPSAPARADRRPLTVAFVLDRSGSMSGQKLALAKRAIDAALNMLGRKTVSRWLPTTIRSMCWCRPCRRQQKDVRRPGNDWIRSRREAPRTSAPAGSADANRSRTTPLTGRSPGHCSSATASPIEASRITTSSPPGPRISDVRT